MDVPESYSTKDMTRRIVVPAVNKLLKIKEFVSLQYKYSYKGKKAIRIIFTWHPEKTPKQLEAEQGTSKQTSTTTILERNSYKPLSKEQQEFWDRIDNVNSGALWWLNESDDDIPM